MDEISEDKLDDDRCRFETRAVPWTYWLPALFGVLLMAAVLIVVLALGPELSSA